MYRKQAENEHYLVQKHTSEAYSEIIGRFKEIET